MRNYVRLWLFFSPTIFSRAPRLSRHSAGDTIGELRLLPLANEMKYLQQQKKSKWKYGEISTQRVFWEMQIVFELLYSEYCDSISNRWRNRYVSTHFFLSLPFHLYFCELFHSSFSTMFPCGIMRFEITEKQTTMEVATTEGNVWFSLAHMVAMNWHSWCSVFACSSTLDVKCDNHWACLYLQLASFQNERRNGKINYRE